MHLIPNFHIELFTLRFTSIKTNLCGYFSDVHDYEILEKSWKQKPEDLKILFCVSKVSWKKSLLKKSYSSLLKPKETD